MRLWKTAALLASILPLAALSACKADPVYSVPPLNAADQARLTCPEYPEIKDALKELPAHVFLAGSSGVPVVTEGRFKWVRFDIVNEREALLIEFADIAGRDGHFECRDNLLWLADLWTGLER